MIMVLKVLCIIAVCFLYFLMFIAGWLAYENKQINQLLQKNDNIGQIADEGRHNDRC